MTRSKSFALRLDERSDDIAGAFKVFNSIRKKYPEDLWKYCNLAIATSVVWDDGSKQSMALVRGAAGQAKAKYSSAKETHALENFKFFVDNEKYMQGRALKAPWEVLTFVVYQRTSLEERKWALEKFGNDQSKIGKIYSKPAYDDLMWTTRFKECKLAGKDYTLQNILETGGVCVQRADFSSRIAMNMAIPASRALERTTIPSLMSGLFGPISKTLRTTRSSIR